jgi:hypothetical protein
VLATLGVLAFATTMLSSAVAADASPPSNSQPEARHQCVNYPDQGARIGSRGNTNGVSAIDVTGCTSWIYEELPVLVPSDFFAGAGFRTGISAYEYGAVETTKIEDGHQVDVVINPTPTWMTAYAGFESCATSGSQTKICTITAVRKYSGGWYWDIAFVAVLAGLLLLILYHARPGPARRRRRSRRLHNPLAIAMRRQK